MIPEDNRFRHSFEGPKELLAQWSLKSALGAVLEAVPGGGKNCRL